MDCSNGKCGVALSFKSYQERRAFSDSHLPAVWRILSATAFKIASINQDRTKAIDFYTNSRGYAYRMRTEQYLAKDRDVFVIRASRTGNHKSEMQKLMLGGEDIADAMVYGFASRTQVLYLVDIDLQKWRQAIKEKRAKGKLIKPRNSEPFVVFPILPEYSTILDCNLR